MYAGDVFESARPPARRVAGGGWVAAVAILAIVAAAGGWWWYTRHGQFPRLDSGPVRVVGDRPGGVRRGAGAAINEAEAVMTLRRHFASQPEPVRGECLAIIGRGYSNGYYSFDAVDSCDRTKLGRWRVNGQTRAVGR